jgi:hypothetical protein
MHNGSAVTVTHLFLRIKKYSPCAYIEGEKEQTVT